MTMSALQAVASLTTDNKIDILLPDNWDDYRKQIVVDICRTWPIIGKVIRWPSERFNEKEYGLWFYSAHGSMSDIVHLFLRNMKYYPVPKPNWRKTLIHESDHYMEIAYAMGYEGPIPKVEFPLADEPILKLPKPIIGLCNGWFRTEKQYWEKKSYPWFGRLAATLKHYFGGTVVGIGRKGELSTETIVDINYAGQLSILETAKVLSQLDLFITTDTGPMHLANILDVSLIALFGSGLVSKNGPRGKNSSVIRAGLNCVPCQDTGAFYGCQKNLCMESIAISDILAVARGKLNGTHIA